MDELSLDDYLNNYVRKEPVSRKHGNRHIKRDGQSYDSVAEYRYEGILKMRKAAGEITGYMRQVPIPLIAEGGQLIGYYKADFIVEFPDGSRQIHDVKAEGQETELFIWKKKHVKAQYGDEIILINSKTLKPI